MGRINVVVKVYFCVSDLYFFTDRTMPFRGGGDGDKPVGMQSISTLEELSNNPDSAVTKRSARIHLGLSPGTLSNIKQGLEAQLLPQINRYYPALGAILLGWVCGRFGYRFLFSS